jgi:hypothetical protein
VISFNELRQKFEKGELVEAYGNNFEQFEKFVRDAIQVQLAWALGSSEAKFFNEPIDSTEQTRHNRFNTALKKKAQETCQRYGWKDERIELVKHVEKFKLISYLWYLFYVEKPDKTKSELAHTIKEGYYKDILLQEYPRGYRRGKEDQHLRQSTVTGSFAVIELVESNL